MAENELIERLDAAIDAMLAGDLRAGVVDPEVAMLALVGAELHGVPDREFKRELKRRILPMTTETTAVPQTLMPYLAVDGAERMIEFLERAFGARVQLRVPRPDAPERLMHSEIAIGDSVIELGDTSEVMSEPRRFELHLYVEDADATYARAVAAGAKTLHAPVDQPYGDREASIEDPFGNFWYIATHGAEVRPAGFGSVTPFFHAYRAPEFIDFVKSTFGAREESRYAEGERILHAVLFVGDLPIEVGSAHGQWQPMPAALHAFVDDVDAAYERALAAGAESLFGPADQPYGQRMAGVKDLEGNFWYLAKPL